MKFAHQNKLFSCLLALFSIAPAHAQTNHNSSLAAIHNSSLVANHNSSIQAAKQADLQPGQQLKVEFVASQPCALVQFVNILAERHHTSGWVKGWYEKQCKTNPALVGNLQADKAPLAAYQKLIDREEKHFHYVDEIGRDRSVDEVILCQAARCNYIPELIAKLKGTLSEDDLHTLQNTLNHFLPAFDDLIWKPRSATFKRQVEEFRQQTAATKMCERLTQVRQFLGSSYPTEKPFLIALSPLPAGGKQTSGQSMGIVQTVELKPNDKFQTMADVVFHEAVHALWFAKKDANEAMKLFTIPGKGALPITELYEGMATALGQGWFAKEAFGRTGKSWYADPIIDHYSKTVWPLYADYLKQRRKLDAAFAREATACYYRMYPAAAERIVLTSCYLILADEMQDFSGFRKEVYKAMPRLRECSINTPINAKEGFQAFEDSHADRVAILTSFSKIAELKPLGITDREIQKLKGKSFHATTLEFKGKQILFCLAETSEDQKRVFYEVLKLQNWPRAEK